MSGEDSLKIEQLDYSEKVLEKFNCYVGRAT